MNGIITSELIQPALDVLLKTMVILLVAYIVTRATGKASAAFRHLIWTLAVVAVLVTPIVGPILPRISLPLFDSEILALDTGTALPDSSRQLIATGDNGATTSVGINSDFVSSIRNESESGGGLEAEASDLTVHSPALRWPEIILLVWFSGSAMLLIINLSGMRVARRVIRLAQEAGRNEKNLGLTLARLLRIKRRIRFLIADSLFVPFTVGLIMAKIVLKNGGHDDQESTEAVLLHELAHVKRNDVLTQTLARAACVVFWFNPLVWMAARRMMIERELACDDFVLNHGGRPSSYAQQLLELAASCRPDRRPSWATVAMARRNHFRERVMSILNPNTDRRGAGRVRSIATALAAILIILPLSAMQFWSSPSTTTEAKESLAPAIQSGTSEDVIQPKDGDVFKRYRPFLFKIKSMEPLAGVTASFLGRKITFKEQGDNIWEGLTAIGQDATAGPQAIVLRVSYTDGKVNEYTKTIQIEPEPEKTRSVLLDDSLDLQKRKMMYLNQQKEEELGQLFAHSMEIQRWNWPFILPAEGRVSMQFHTTLILDKDKRISHNGVDLSMPAGTPIKASNNGKVVLVEENPVRGKIVVIDHGGGIFTGYMHLSQVSVTQGQEVDQGEVIGRAGSTGISTGPHLHWFLNINGVYCDPMKLIDSSN